MVGMLPSRKRAPKLILAVPVPPESDDEDDGIPKLRSRERAPPSLSEALPTPRAAIVPKPLRVSVATSSALENNDGKAALKEDFGIDGSKPVATMPTRKRRRDLEGFVEAAASNLKEIRQSDQLQLSHSVRAMIAINQNPHSSLSETTRQKGPKTIMQLAKQKGTAEKTTRMLDPETERLQSLRDVARQRTRNRYGF